MTRTASSRYAALPVIGLVVGPAASAVDPVPYRSPPGVIPQLGPNEVADLARRSIGFLRFRSEVRRILFVEFVPAEPDDPDAARSGRSHWLVDVEGQFDFAPPGGPTTSYRRVTLIVQDAHGALWGFKPPPPPR